MSLIPDRTTTTLVLPSTQTITQTATVTSVHEVKATQAHDGTKLTYGYSSTGWLQVELITPWWHHPPSLGGQIETFLQNLLHGTAAPGEPAAGHLNPIIGITDVNEGGRELKRFRFTLDPNTDISNIDFDTIVKESGGPDISPIQSTHEQMGWDFTGSDCIAGFKTPSAVWVEWKPGTRTSDLGDWRRYEKRPEDQDTAFVVLPWGEKNAPVGGASECKVQEGWGELEGITWKLLCAL